MATWSGSMRSELLGRLVHLHVHGGKSHHGEGGLFRAKRGSGLMSAIFISHSSADKDAATELLARLKDRGHRSVFLDFDPADGIPAGRDWERELYQRLRACQAFIVLCSQQSMASKWCFAEITHAKSLGKQIFVMKIEECDLSGLLTSTQFIDLTADRDAGYERLWRGLAVAGLDPNDAFDWDGSQPPYPGLLAFRESDAAIFFGRDDEIHEGLGELNRLWQFGGDAGLIVLGPSGTGKSSFVRAGLLPRLRRDPDRWLIVPPFRPGPRPWLSLAMVLSHAFEACGDPRDRGQLQDQLEKSALQGSSSALVEIGLDLLGASRRADARVLLVVDQMEEVLGHPSSGDSPPFLPAFVSALSDASGSLMMLGTLRSDFLAALQKDPGFEGFKFKDLRINPLPLSRIAQVIEGPAALAGLDLEPGLSHAITQDAERGDALPLLAFALRELYERFGDDGLLTVEEYRTQLGGLQNAVALVAEEAFEQNELPEAVARRAFLSMVRVDEDGLFARRPTRRNDLPEAALPMIESFVRARLLVSDVLDGRNVVEVAHEALIRNWDRLHRWVNEDRGYLLWRRRLDHYVREWESADRDRAALLRGRALAETRRWLAERDEEMTEEQETFVAASEAEVTRKRRRVTATAVLVGLAAAGVVWGASFVQRRALDQAQFEAIVTVPRLPAQWPDSLPNLILTEQQFVQLVYSLEDLAGRERVTPARALALRAAVREAFIQGLGPLSAPPDQAADSLNRRIRIAGGSFAMGSTDGPSDEQPVRQVTVSSFSIQQHEVTNEEFQRFHPDHSFLPGQERYPVVEVNWFGAMAYAAWLGGTLPTEAQWEFAARGAEGRVYPWGDSLPRDSDGCEAVRRVVIYGTCSLENPEPVMLRPDGATPEGVHDLAGNVWEWVSDWFSPSYDPGDVTDPRGAYSGTERVLRGGAFGVTPDRVTGSFRGYANPNMGRGRFGGFRVVWPEGWE